MNKSKKLSAVLVLILALALLAAAPATAKEPLGNDYELDFNLGVIFGEGCAPTTAWFGHITLDDDTYGIVFDDGPMIFSGPVAHWVEDWRIYDSLSYTIVGGVVTECVYGNVVLAGSVEGIAGPNGGGPMNGIVSEAYGDFAEWEGRRVHGSGSVTAAYTDGDLAGLPIAAAMAIRFN